MFAAVAARRVARLRVPVRQMHVSARLLAEPRKPSQESIDIVKATAPVIGEYGYKITRTMYGRMHQIPEVRRLFNTQGHQHEINGEPAQQPQTLACTVHAYAQYIDQPHLLTDAINRMVHKHVSLHVLEPHYKYVGENLLWAVKEVLGDAATPAIMKAWEEAYIYLQDILVAAETELREARRDQPGGWEGWRDFVVDKKVKESDIITSFYLKPADGGKIPVHIPGEYIGMMASVPGHNQTTRNYTISSAPGKDYYRITVKREEGDPPGLVSTYLHDQVKVGDTLEIGVPVGEFVLKDTPVDKPVCFISGGVGLTPLVSMLEAMVASKEPRHIYYLDCVRNKEVEAMHDYFSHVSSKNLNVNVKFIYDDPPDEFHPRGPITAEHVKLCVPSPDCHFYVCGPRPFMSKLLAGLHEWGVPQDQIHYHHFGPFNPNTDK